MNNFPEYTKNPNVVANMSSQEYFKRKLLELGLENFPQIEFVAIPTAHDSLERAQEIIDITKRNNADILLIENVTAYSGGINGLINGAKKLKTKKSLDFIKGIGESQKIFYNFLLSETERLGIICDTYEFKRQTIEDVLNYLEKMQESYKMIYNLDIKSFYDTNDQDGALEKLSKVLASKNGFQEIQTEREWLILNNISPRVFELLSKDKELLKKDKIKVAYFVGAAHKQGFIDSMLERGDNLKLEEAKDFKDFKVNIRNYNLTFLASLFFGCFTKDLNKEDAEFLLWKIQSNEEFKIALAKSPQKVIDVIMEAKEKGMPVEYFIENLNKLKEID